jgi:hypothetical protein
MGLRNATEAVGKKALHLRKCLHTLVQLAESDPNTPIGDGDVLQVLLEATNDATAIVGEMYGEDAID